MVVTKVVQGDDDPGVATNLGPSGTLMVAVASTKRIELIQLRL